MDTEVFISHAVKDEALASKVVDLLETGVGINSRKIFCSSVESLGIVNGEDFVIFIKEKLVTSKVVIMLLSQNFFDSHFCLCELGAAWVLPLKTKLLIVPPLNYEDVKGVLISSQCGKINEPTHLTNLRDNLIEILGLKSDRTSRWEVKRDEFLEGLSEVIDSLGQPTKVNREEYNELESKYRESLAELLRYRTKIEGLEEVNSKLVESMDRDESLKIILESSSDWEKLKVFSGQMRDSLKKLIPHSHVVEEALYYYARGEHYYPEPEQFYQVKYMVENDRLESFDPEDGDPVKLNLSDPKIKKVIQSIEDFAGFLEEVDEAFYEAFEAKYEYEPKITSRKLWTGIRGKDFE